MTTVSSSSAAVTEGAKVVTPSWMKNVRNGKLRVMCRYGGSIVSIPQTKSPRYIGGDTRIVAVPSAVETSFTSLVSHLKATLGISYPLKVKYQLPDQELDSLISVETDEDVQIMMEEYGYLSSDSSIPQTRIRLFLFPSKSQLSETDASQGDLAQCKSVTEIDWLGMVEESKPIRQELTPPVLQHPKTDTWFVDALKSVEMMQTGRDNSGSSGSGDGNGGICGQESMMLETSSPFGSTSSSVSSSNLPPLKSTGEDSMANSQVKFAPIESVTSDNTVLTPISSHQLPLIRPHVFENKASSHLYEAELNRPVPIPVSVYPPFMNQAQQQHIQVIYTGQPYITGNTPMTLPATAYQYHHTNPIHYQFPPQPYPVYYIPVEQYSLRHVQAPPAKPGTVINTHQVDSPVIRTSSPLAPELSSQVYSPPKPVDSSEQISSEAALSTTCGDAFICNTDLDDDTARAQIYKTQPPAPAVPSEYQTRMLTEALGQLHTHNT
ncbi:Protein PAL OF QUIRKY [Cardamine amara subsp. amara]|uniref:Protein PAL OF QUIRKY n=1 Tax=Cardamine amara subsp. amara TaxID=228776 RepID=A0ABD1ARB9_CARAN